MANLPGGTKTPVSSSNRKSVILRQWWLIKLQQESKLGVGGFVKKETLESLGMRVFGSASAGKRGNLKTLENETQEFESSTIVKKLENNTLEAADGSIITITGCINRSRTLSYGFSHEVCDRFLSGFPCTWEEYAAKLTHEKCTNTTEQSFPVTFDDLPVTQVRDLLMSTTEKSKSCALTSIIFRDIMKHCSEVSLNQNAASVDSDDKVFRNSTETELDHKQDGFSLLNPTPKIIEEHKINLFPVDLHDKDLETSKEAEDTLEGGGFMLNVTHKISKKNQAKRRVSQTRYPLRSTRKRKTLEV